MAEEMIFQDGLVCITTARVVIQGGTYAVRNITSVRMQILPVSKGCAAMLLVVGLTIAIGGLAIILQGDFGGIGGLLMGISVSVVAWLWLRTFKPSYRLMIANAAGEVSALTSTDQSYISRLVAAVNEAVVRYR